MKITNRHERILMAPPERLPRTRDRISWRLADDPTLANGQPAAAAYYSDDNGTHQALGVAVLTATSTGVARITVFPGGPALAARFGLPPSRSGRGQ